MNKEPETYEELIRMKRCVDLTKYYELTKNDVCKVYDFLVSNLNGEVSCGVDNITLHVGQNIIEVIESKRTNFSIDGIKMGNSYFNVISHYVPSSSSSYSGGSSSNNNNNNNNNNNR